MGGGARSAPFGMLMTLKRRVRAAHGRMREAKTHYLYKNALNICIIKTVI
jgi:hypothetical protein